MKIRSNFEQLTVLSATYWKQGVDGEKGLRRGRCDEDEIAAGEERNPLVWSGEGCQRAATATYFTSCLSLHRPPECKMQSAAAPHPHPPTAIFLSASAHLTRGEVDHEGEKKEEKKWPQTVEPESSTLICGRDKNPRIPECLHREHRVCAPPPRPAFIYVRSVMAGKTTLQQVGGRWR